MREKSSLEEESDVNDLVLVILREHEKKLGRLIANLSEALEHLRDSGELIERLERAKDQLEALRVEMSNIAKCRFGKIY